MAERTVAVPKYKVPNPTQLESENQKMYAIKQIGICAYYREIVPKASGSPFTNMV